MSDYFSHESNQEKAKHLVILLPGVHLRELQRLLRISFNSTRYDVEKLCRSVAIVSHKDKKYLRFYPQGIKDSEKIVYASLRNSTLRSILAELLDAGGEGLTNKQLSQRTRLAKSTVSENVQHLKSVVPCEIIFSFFV